MNVLLLDQFGFFVDFALRCRWAGHNVKTCMAKNKETGQRYRTGDGLIEKIENEDWQRHMGWADLVMHSDCGKWLRELDMFKKKGFPIFAPSYESAQLEMDRGKGQALMQKCGLDVMSYEVFNDFKKAEKYVLAEKKQFVAKPMGDKDKALSYVSKSTKDMLFMLRRWADDPKKKGEFLLQEFTPGVEFSATGWLGKNGFSKFINEGFEHKKLMNDDKGPNTGEMGTAIKYVENSQLATEVLLPMERELIKMGHRGQIDVSVIVDETGSPRPLEFTARLGWPCMHIMQSLHSDPCSWMVDLLDGNDTFVPSTDVAVGVVVAMPPFPCLLPIPAREVEGIPIYGLNDDNQYRQNISPVELMSGSAPMDDGKDTNMMVSASDYLVICTGTGGTVREAQKMAYKVVDSLEIPNSPEYRTDIGDRCKEGIKTLQEYGFAKEWTW